MRNKRALLALGLIMGAIAVFSFIKIRAALRVKPVIEEMAQKLEQKILSFDMVSYAEDGTKKWKLEGDSADILAEIVNLSNIHMETFDEPKITLTARRGDYDRDTKEISLFDDVIVLTSDGVTIKTDYLKWDGKNDTVTTDKAVRIERSDVVADGIGAVAMPQMKKVTLKKDVTVVFAASEIKDIDMSLGEEKDMPEKEDKAEKTTITCNGPLEMDYEKNIAIFNDDVVVDSKKGKIYSDRMEAYLDPDTKDIIKVIAEGEVRVVRGDDSTYSRKAIYLTEEEKIILIGRPRIYIRSLEEADEMGKKLRVR